MQNDLNASAEQTPVVEAYVDVDRSSSRCGACGGNADPNEDSHIHGGPSPSGYTRGSSLSDHNGCGAVFVERRNNYSINSEDEYIPHRPSTCEERRCDKANPEWRDAVNAYLDGDKGALKEYDRWYNPRACEHYDPKTPEPLKSCPCNH